MTEPAGNTYELGELGQRVMRAWLEEDGFLFVPLRGPGVPDGEVSKHGVNAYVKIKTKTRADWGRITRGLEPGQLQGVRVLPLPGRLLSLIAPLLATMPHLNRQLAYSDAAIEHLAVQDPRGPRLRSVPNVGPVTAAFIATIDDAQRFHRRIHLWAWAGRRGRATQRDGMCCARVSSARRRAPCCTR